jgi:hypothetical protein
MDLQRRSFAEVGHRAPSGRSTGEQGGKGKSGGPGLGNRTLSISSQRLFYFRLEPVG